MKHAITISSRQVDLSKCPAAVRATIEKAIFLRFGSRQADSR